MSLLLQALKQIDAKPATVALPAGSVRTSISPEPIPVKPPASLSTPIASPPTISPPIVSPPTISAPAAAAANLAASTALPRAAPIASSDFSGAAPLPVRKSPGESAPRPPAARAIADVATNAQRKMAEAVLAMLTGPRRLLALVAVDAPSDVCSPAGDLALGLAARETGDVLLVGSAGEPRHTVAGGRQQTLAGIISGRTSWADAVLPSGLEHLSLLERGTHADEQLLTAPRFTEAWQALPRQFHHVVIDAGSAGAASPSPLLSTCDAILLVVRLGATSQAQVDDALKRLRSIGLSPSGCLALAARDSCAAA